MNFLAHALLAGTDPAMIVGGVVGDWIKGPLPGLLPSDLTRGVALHRAIDSFAETNHAFCRSRNRMSAVRRRYAGVLVDIFYDHLLARDWDALHPTILPTFNAQVYRHVADRRPDLPSSSHQALDTMSEQDWLTSYASMNGIADVLKRMSRYARQPNPLSGGEEELLADLPGFQADFNDWLLDARTFSRKWLEHEADH